MDGEGDGPSVSLVDSRYTMGMVGDSYSEKEVGNIILVNVVFIKNAIYAYVK